LLVLAARRHAGDDGDWQHTVLDQIDASNYQLESRGPRPTIRAGTAGVILLDGRIAARGAPRQANLVHRYEEGERGLEAPRRLSGRGLAYWTDGREERIVYVTPGYRMIALDARTGVPIPGFGTGGVVDLKLEAGQDMNLITGDLGLHAAPVIARNVIVVGSAHTEGSRPVSRRNEKGVARYGIAPASACGSFAPSRSLARKVRRPGNRTPGRTPGTPASGGRLPSTNRSASSTCRPRRPPATTTADTGPAGTCFRARSSRST
jgi:hypothetical protein